ncbi:hypothetical protein ABID19_006872 [Mesorhizobium robiniae]|uniref:Transposase n=1 Tax=Mesorhizobium robiniae TaxID=559315 RepID=A0ABV2GZU4_9HYPH|nr:hypothetical protein [Mesorhizobium sp. ZC-5]MCV3244063.1 hypothetical protein [Mesorhizobium sp. ZC-5]
MISLTTADIYDRAGAQAILDGILQRCSWEKHLLAATAHDWPKLLDKAAYPDFLVMRRSNDQKEFQIPRCRGVVVERTFSWMARWRHLVRNY